MSVRKTLIINRSLITRHLTFADYVKAVEDVHALHARGEVIAPGMLHADADVGEYHIKTGGTKGITPYFGLKANGGFFQNQKHEGLPNILGLIYLSDARNGYPLAILDSVEISKKRTAAATAVAAKYLAPVGELRLGIVGYGNQAATQIEAMLSTKNVKDISVSGRDRVKAESFAMEIFTKFNIQTKVVSEKTLAETCNTIITCTPATHYFIKKEWVQPGTFIAAIGADSPGKNELEPMLMASATIVTDIRAQAVRVGESQHAIAQKLITPEGIYAELGELVIGAKNGRTSDSQTFVYDSTGTALQDVAVAAFLYEKLKESPQVMKINIFS
jgi:ornithine cyclodeaminase/alanine dehydrogenase